MDEWSVTLINHFIIFRLLLSLITFINLLHSEKMGGGEKIVIHKYVRFFDVEKTILRTLIPISGRQLWHFIVPFITEHVEACKKYILPKLLQFHNLMRPFYSAGALSDSPVINFKRIDSFRAKNPLQLTFFPSPFSTRPNAKRALPWWKEEKRKHIYIYLSLFYFDLRSPCIFQPLQSCWFAVNQNMAPVCENIARLTAYVYNTLFSLSSLYPFLLFLPLAPLFFSSYPFSLFLSSYSQKETSKSRIVNAILEAWIFHYE